ncbi:acetylornithine deacetylase [Roseisalinus antarcticus]|uniref:Acetylornithine deacetylase n=1 Tax=Roseisalinus antarcticus TaxID=254357 RepID=A0A1Y5TZZ5_9RHOB|nr:acetylornithine deacetylase [Roseisalinus antarcticus]SLN72611.1 Acetylornithine deacetylase [Roseisalinus antarcticus]
MTGLTETIAHLGRLVAYPTVSTDSNLALITDTAERLEALGAKVEILHDTTWSKANLWATFGPDVPGGIVLSGHTDVVPVDGQHWSSDPFLLTETDNGLAARGACDMKGFIAACMAMAPRFAERATQRPVHFAFTYDEEVGCIGGQALVDALRTRGAQPAMAIIGEPTSMQVIEGHKGCCEYSVRFTGLAGHGSSPDCGVNAVDYAVRYVTRLHALAEDLKGRTPRGSRFEPPWTTINVGRLNGGQAHNVIPSEADLSWEMRPVQPSDTDFVREAIESYASGTLLPAMRAVHPEAAIETEVIGDVRGLEPMEPNAARDLVAELTGANGAGTVPFGTEAGLFQSMGLSAVVCGPGSIDQAHKPDEWIAKDQLQACLAFLDRLSTRLS